MQILHSLPGRVRIKNNILYHDKELSQYINAYCDHLYGVKHSHVDHKTGTILIVYNQEETESTLLFENIEHAISAALNGERKDLKGYEEYYITITKRNKARKWFLIYGITYLLFKVKQSMFGKFSISRNIRVLEVASLVTIIGGYPLIKGLYKKLTKKVPADSDILLKLSAVSLTLLRESTKGVLVLLLKELADYAKYSADIECMRTLRKNMSETTGMAYLVMDKNQEILVPVKDLCMEDVVAVHEGEIVSVEGEVIEGTAIVNSLYHIGQPLVSELAEGNKVYEGMIILSGDLKVKVTKIPEMNQKVDISEKNIKMYRHVKGYSENIAYASFGLAVLHYLFTRSALGAISIMLVLSPSATGTVFSSGMKNYATLLSKNKIYMRNPNAFEKITHVDHVIFDKTGTLTYGDMRIIGIESFDKKYSQKQLLNICAACEVDNYHPISVTLQEESEMEYDIEKVQSSVLLPSKGIVAVYEDKNILIGSQKLMTENNVEISEGINLYNEWEKRFCTPIFIAIDDSLAGIIVMDDVLRKDASELIYKLKRRGIKNITLLTEDNKDKASHTAELLGIQQVYCNCSNEDKVRIVKELKENDTVMMIGDGVNDIQAMKEADVSLSFIDSACDKVKLHSDCIILENNMTRVPDLISLSQKSYQCISQNILATNGYNVIFGILAFLQNFDVFAAKSINTINSLMVLLLNQRINHLKPGKITIDIIDNYAKNNHNS